MAIKVSVSGSDRVDRKLKNAQAAVKGKQLERALVAGGLILQNDGKRRAPFITGNLRRSIHIGGHENLNPEGRGIVQTTGKPVPSPEVSGTDAAIYVGTDVEYAAAKEFGTETMDAKPYMRPAMDGKRKEIANEVGAALKDLIQAAV